MSIRSVLLGLAAAGTAYAQCSVRATATIENAADATAIAGCRTFTGSISVATEYAGGLSFSGIEKIQGSFIASNVSQINSITFERLAEITEDFIIDGAPRLAQLTFPSLKAVGKGIRWIALAGLQAVNVGPITKAASLRVENTVLQNLNSFDLASVGDYVIANNNFLREISAQLGNVTNALEITGNSQPEVSFPNLIWARNMTFRNCSNINLPSVTTINGSMSFIGNTFESILLPNLTRVGSDVNNGGGSLVFSHNAEATNISAPALTYIGGGFTVANNTELPAIDQFGKVETVMGALDFYGKMTKIALPALDSVRGAFNIQSNEDIGNACDPFKKLQSAKKIQGKYFCEGKLVEVGDKDSNPTSNNSNKPDSAAGTLSMPLNVVIGVSGVLAFIASAL